MMNGHDEKNRKLRAQALVELIDLIGAQPIEDDGAADRALDAQLANVPGMECFLADLIPLDIAAQEPVIEEPERVTPVAQTLEAGETGYEEKGPETQEQNAPQKDLKPEMTKEGGQSPVSRSPVKMPPQLKKEAAVRKMAELKKKDVSKKTEQPQKGADGKKPNKTIVLIAGIVTILVAILLLRSGERVKIKGDAAIAMLSVGALAIGYLIMNLFSTSATPITSGILPHRSPTQNIAFAIRLHLS